MSTSTKAPQTIRHGGPGSSHENAKKPPEIRKLPTDDEPRRRSTVSGGGGERDSHHAHDPDKKGGHGRPAQPEQGPAQTGARTRR